MNTLIDQIRNHINLHVRSYEYALSVVLAAAIIILFLNTGLGKIINHTVFSIQMGKQPLPVWSQPILIYALPVIEISIVLLLSIQKTRLSGFFMATITMAIYTIYSYLAYKEVYGYVICACGKIFQQMGWREHFYFNTLFTVISLAGLYLQHKAKKSNVEIQKRTNHTMHSGFRREIINDD